MSFCKPYSYLICLKNSPFDSQLSPNLCWAFPIFTYYYKEHTTILRVMPYIIYFLLDHSDCQAVPNRHSALHLPQSLQCLLMRCFLYQHTKFHFTHSFTVNLRSDFLAVMEKHTNWTQKNTLQVPKSCKDVRVWSLWWLVLKNTIEKDWGEEQSTVERKRC